MNMKEQTWGMEIEFTGITRADAAKAVAKVLGTTSYYAGGSYYAYEAKDSQNRIWKVESDASIQAEDRNGDTASSEYKCELVTPICKYEDIETLQEIVRELRHAKGRGTPSCGIHLHIGLGEHTARSLKNLANIMAAKEDLLFKALAVNPTRAEKWCKKVDGDFLSRLNKATLKDKNDVKKIWYNGHDESGIHYSQTRYRTLNYHACWTHGTIELRCFNSSLKNAGRIKAYIILGLALSHQALTQTCASSKKHETPNAKYAMRCWLLRLGLIGDEFKTARHYLLENLEGDSAWRDNRRAA